MQTYAHCQYNAKKDGVCRSDTLKKFHLSRRDHVWGHVKVVLPQSHCFAGEGADGQRL